MRYFQPDEARTIIRDVYSHVRSDATAVAEAFYSSAELKLLPRAAVELALGVANPLRHAGIRRGEVVLDLGSGGGIDTILAAIATGPEGRAVGIDMTPAMVIRASENAEEAGVTNIEFREGLMEALPLSAESVDVVISNGTLNLSTRKSRALAEAKRVLRPGGRLVIADLVLDEALPEELLKSPAALAG